MSRRAGQLGRAVGAVAAAGALVGGLAAPAIVAAHSLDATYQSRLPLAVYLAGAAATVALSFAFVLVRDVRADAPPDNGSRIVVPRAVRLGLRGLGLVGWLWIVAQGVAGGSSDGDVASLFLWVYGWVGLALVSALVGPVWHWLDPFSTLHDLGAAALRALGVGRWDRAEYPRRLGRWPAVAGFAFFVWLELVLGGGLATTLTVVLLGYTAFTVAMMAQFGRDEWRAGGEVFSVWFRLLGRVAPLALTEEEGGVRRRGYAAGLLEPGWSRADVVLVALGTGSILYDGLSQTAPWYALFGFPAPAGATVQLVAFLGLIAVAAVLVAGWVGVASTGAGLLPIAVGYLAAHYLTFLLVDGQRILIALSDPLQQGWDVFGTAFHEPTAAFLPPGLVWTIQLASVVGGHMVGAWAGHVSAAGEAGASEDGRTVRIRQVPLAVVMVTLTTVTLWSLGQAIVVEEPSAAAGALSPSALAPR